MSTPVKPPSTSVKPIRAAGGNLALQWLQSRGTTMLRLMLLAALGTLATTTPGSAQDPRPPVRDGEIVIPSQRTLEREAVTQPQNDFSTNDAIATQQMERQNRRIDREVEKGICSDCR
jgi:hypothetical protein